MDVHDQLLEVIKKSMIVRTASLTEIGHSVAIDAASWFNTLLESEAKTRVVGLSPQRAEKTIKAKLQELKNAGIKPVLVFPGIDLSLEVPLSPNQYADKGFKRSKMWEGVADGNTDSITQEMSRSPVLSEDFVNELIVSLRKDDIECIRAPYQAQSQCAYLESKRIVPAVIGRLDMLLYEVSRLILSFDSTHFKYVSLNETLRATGLNPKRLKEVFLRAGYLFGIQNLKLQKQIEVYTAFDSDQLKNALELIKAAPRLEADKPNRLRVNPAQKLVKYLGLRLPDSFYSALMLSFVSTKEAEALTSGTYVELPPLADSKYYRRCLANMKVYRYRSLKLLTEHLAPVFEERPVNVVYWYKQASPERITGQFKKLKWSFTAGELAEELRRQNKQSPDLVFSLKWHYDSYGQDWPLSSDYTREESKSSSADEGIARALLRFLQQTDFISSQGKPMLFGRLLMTTPPELQEATMVLLELFKQGLLNGHTIPQHKSTPINPNKFETLVAFSTDVPEDRRYLVNLVSRVFTLVPATVVEEDWTGPIDYSLAQFHSLVKLISKTFRSLLESELLAQFLGGKLTAGQLIEATPRLPFLKNSGAVNGLLVKHLLLNDQDRLIDIQSKFPQCPEIKRDLMRGWDFWVVVMKVVKAMKSYDVIEPSTLEMYERASQTLRNVLLRLNIGQ